MTRQYVNGSLTTELTRGKPYFSAGLRVVRSRRLYHCPSYNSSEVAHDVSINRIINIKSTRTGQESGSQNSGMTSVDLSDRWATWGRPRSSKRWRVNLVRLRRLKSGEWARR
jgi:hypothetical protein